jgi:hypothetical protein
MTKKAFVLVAIVSMLIVAVGVVSAQGNGNGADNGRGGPNGNCDPQQANCIADPQLHAYGNGGIGFVNAANGNQWNQQQRGQIGRGSGQNGAGFYAGLPPAVTDTLPDDVVALMVSGWIDEQHAYAVYEAVIAQFGDVQPFVNIQIAEAQHSAAWEFLFERYGIAVPELPTFDLPQVSTLAEACQIAADAEIANFSLYDQMLTAFEPYPDLYQVALALRNASEFNHLPAFQNCAG